MRFRKLRIAWSVGCLITCALLIVLWVRSYRVVDMVHIPAATETIVSSANGGIDGWSFSQHINSGWPPGWGWKSLSAKEDFASLHSNSPRWYYNSAATSAVLRFRLWLPVLIFATFAVVPWVRSIPRRFTLCTLLIATTLVAVVLGLIVWLNHH